MSEANRPVLVEADYSLEQIFAATAEAVVGAQRRLDAELLAPYRYTYQLPRERRLFSIPRTTVELVFGLEIDEQRMLMMLVPRGKARRQLHRHRLVFSVVAQPAPPPPSPPALSPPGGIRRPGFVLTAPGFLLAADEEDALRALLLSALYKGQENKTWRSLLPDGKTLNEGQLDDERFMIATAQPESETGMVYFRLDGETPAYLVVRVTDKSANDSVFVLRPGAPLGPLSPPGPLRVDVYSTEKDGSEQIRYAPLHRLGLALRRWQSGETPARTTAVPGGVPFRFGLQYLQTFAEGMLDGYANGLVRIAAQPGAEATGVWYDFSEAGAELSYTVEYEETKRPRFRFDLRRPPDNQPAGSDEAYKLIESRALVFVGRGRGGEPRATVELLTPEFMLSGDAWLSFMSLVGNSVEEIARAFAESPDDQTRYRHFLRQNAYRRDAVVLLAYRGKTPKEEFLAIWPGLSREGLARDFVFTSKRRGDRLVIGEKVMTLDDDLTKKEVKIPTPAAAAADSNITGEQYQPFHNFFHAVRIWRARMRPS